MPVRFLDGPPPQKEWGWSGVATELRSRPGVWAVVREPDLDGSLRKVDSAHAYLTRKGSPHMPLTEYEIVRREGFLYARYLGNGDEG